MKYLFKSFGHFLVFASVALALIYCASIGITHCGMQMDESNRAATTLGKLKGLSYDGVDCVVINAMRGTENGNPKQSFNCALGEVELVLEDTKDDLILTVTINHVTETFRANLPRINDFGAPTVTAYYDEITFVQIGGDKAVTLYKEKS